MSNLKSISKPEKRNLLVAFTDFTNFARLGNALSEQQLFEMMNEYFEMAGSIVESADGLIVKCIGDSLMIVFPEEKANVGVQALVSLKEQADRFMKDRGHACREVIKIHFGEVFCGPLGPASDKRFDIYGQTVNIAAMTKSKGIALTPQAFRKLEDSTRKLFKKHTPPVVYIPIEESH